LDVVARYYRVARYLSCYSWLAFYHTVIYCHYCECRVTFRCGLTADSRLHTARVCRRALVKLRGLMQICRSNFYDLHNSVDRTRRVRGNGIAVLAWPPKKLSPVAAVACLNARLLSRQSTDQTKCVLAAPCHRLAIYQGLSNNSPQDNCRRSALFVCSVCTGDQCARRDVHWCAISYDLWVMRHRLRSMNTGSILRNRYERWFFLMSNQQGLSTK